MSREIKFRAWSKCAPNAEHSMNYWKLGSGLDNSVFFRAATEQPYGIGAVMQFTGLQDKNGKEIYEGDVLQKFEQDYASDEYKAWGESGYEGEEPPFSIKTVDYCTLESFRYWLKHESFGYEGEELQSPDDWEVIGNIYENPELVKQ